MVVGLEVVEDARQIMLLLLGRLVVLVDNDEVEVDALLELVVNTLLVVCGLVLLAVVDVLVFTVVASLIGVVCAVVKLAVEELPVLAVLLEVVALLVEDAVVVEGRLVEDGTVLVCRVLVLLEVDAALVIVVGSVVDENDVVKVDAVLLELGAVVGRLVEAVLGLLL